MQSTEPDIMPRYQVRLAGLLYLVIIVLGIGSEGIFRGSLVVAGDASATAANIVASETMFRLSIAGDALMAVCDIALAALLYILFRPVNRTLALMAMVFRLIQAAVIAFNLLNLDLALIHLASTSGRAGAEVSALRALELHAHGYDIGLIFFAVNSLITGWLILQSRLMPAALGIAVILAGVVYLVGSFLVLLAPALAEPFGVAYLIPVVVESLLCLWLIALVDPARANSGDLAHAVSSERAA